MAIELLIFADTTGRWWRAAQRLQSQARSISLIDRVTLLDESWLFREAPLAWMASSTFPKTRGFGYWRWKPLAIASTIAHSTSRFVLYLDAGCEFNITPASQSRLQHYLQLTEDNSMLLMSQRTNLLEWCKAEAWLAFGQTSTSVKAMPMVTASAMFLRSGEYNPVLARWLESANTDNGHLFDDQLDPEIQPPEFKDHRHDQAILSLVANEMGLPLLPDETYFEGEWGDAASAYPIWTMRNRHRFTLHPGSVVGRLANRARHLRNLATSSKNTLS